MTRVLVVDDSVAVRGLVSSLLAEDPDIEVAGVAANGRLALIKYAQLRPDVVTLDVEMPEMDGLETLRALRKQDPSAVVIMFSSLTSRGAVTTLDALSAGAVDYVAKPEGTRPEELIRALKRDLLVKVKCHGGLKQGPAPSVTLRLARSLAPSRPEIIGIASSTGGPNALMELITALPKNLRAPVVIVQHMPELFTKLLSERLDATSPLHVSEGIEGALVEPGVVYVAPGGHHMEVVRENARCKIHLHEGPQENSCRPAADVLFRSLAAVYGGSVLGVVLTGMGQDGLRGCEAIHRQGGQVIAQDRASSVVWGMPRAVAEAGIATAVLPLGAIGAEIVKRAGLNVA